MLMAVFKFALTSLLYFVLKLLGDPFVTFPGRNNKVAVFPKWINERDVNTRREGCEKGVDSEESFPFFSAPWPGNSGKLDPRVSEAVEQFIPTFIAYTRGNLWGITRPPRPALI